MSRYHKNNLERKITLTIDLNILNCHCKALLFSGIWNTKYHRKNVVVEQGNREEEEKAEARV